MTPEIKAVYEKLPTHVLLIPEVDKWRDGDEWFSNGWRDFSENDVKYFPYKLAIRRPIPAHIREAQAWWIVYNQLATVDPYSREGVIFAFVISPNTPNRFFLEVIKSRSLRGIRKFPNEEAAKNAISILGGEEKISEMFSKGQGLYEEWLMVET
jgi:hypothetical protein